MSARELIILVGLPRSGKSTWARASGHPIVCPDAIRLALHGQAFNPSAEEMVWTMAHYMAESLFLAGHDKVVIDATNVTEKRRREWVSKFADMAEITINVISTPPKECIKRALEGNREDLVPVIERMSKQWDLPVNAEEWLAR